MQLATWARATLKVRALCRGGCRRHRAERRLVMTMLLMLGNATGAGVIAAMCNGAHGAKKVGPTPSQPRPRWQSHRRRSWLRPTLIGGRLLAARAPPGPQDLFTTTWGVEGRVGRTGKAALPMEAAARAEATATERNARQPPSPIVRNTPSPNDTTKHDTLCMVPQGFWARALSARKRSRQGRRSQPQDGRSRSMPVCARVRVSGVRTDVAGSRTPRQTFDA